MAAAGAPEGPSVPATRTRRGLRRRWRRLTAATILTGLVGASLVSAPAPVAVATYGGVNGVLLFGTGIAGGHRVKSVCPDGSGERVLARNAAQPSPHPDGSLIAYAGVGSGYYGLWTMRPDGSDPVRLTDAYGDYAPEWSPDGRRLAAISYVRHGESQAVEQLVLVDPVTGEKTPLMPDRHYDSRYAGDAVKWSPDGQWIYFQAARNVDSYRQGNNLYRITPSGGTPELLLEGMGTHNFQGLDFDPDGTGFVLSRQDIEANVLDQMHYNAGGGAATVLWSGDAFNAERVLTIGSYSPDRESLFLFTYEDTPGPGGRTRLAVGDPDGGIVRYVAEYGIQLEWSSIADPRCTDVDPPPSYLGLQIDELMLQARGREGASYLEIDSPEGGAVDTTAEPYRVVVYDGDGARLGHQALGADLLGELAEGGPLLLGTPAADAALGSTRDATLSVALPRTGQACLTTGTAEVRRGCVTWGCVATPVASPQTVAVAYPTRRTSAQRQGATSSDFRLGTPTPGATNVTGGAAPSCPVPDRLVATERPRIAGRARPGNTLRAIATKRDWEPRAARLSFQWLRDGRAVRGATSRRYEVRRADRGHALKVRVTARKAGYTAGAATSPAKRVRR